MRKIKILFLSTILLSIFSVSAQAADIEWQPKQSDLSVSSLYDSSIMAIAYLQKSGCDGEGQIMFRKSSSGEWQEPVPITKCGTKDKLATPTLAKDTSTNRLFVVWGQVNSSEKRRRGVIFRSSNNGGKSWTKARILVRQPALYSPALVSAAARKKVLWVMYTSPTKMLDTKPSYRIEGFDQSTGKLRKSNFVKSSSGKFRVDDKKTANSQRSVMQLYAGNFGLFAVWRLTDTANKEHWYAGDTEITSGKMTWKWRGFQGGGKNTFFRLGEDRRMYRLTSEIGGMTTTDDPVSYKVDRWSFLKHRFIANYPSVDYRFNSLYFQPITAFTVDKQRNLLVAYLNFGDCQDQGTKPEMVGDGSPAMRSKSPEPSCPGMHIMKTTIGGVRTDSPVYYPFASLVPEGAELIEWNNTGTGLEGISTVNGQIRFYGMLGRQIVSNKGNVINGDIIYSAGITDPVTDFRPYNSYVKEGQ